MSQSQRQNRMRQTPRGRPTTTTKTPTTKEKKKESIERASGNCKQKKANSKAEQQRKPIVFFFGRKSNADGK